MRKILLWTTMDDEERSVLRLAAAMKTKTFSGWIRDVLIEAAQRQLATQNVLTEVTGEGLRIIPMPAPAEPHGAKP